MDLGLSAGELWARYARLGVSPSTVLSQYWWSAPAPAAPWTTSRTASTDSPSQMQIPRLWSFVAAWIGSATWSGTPASSAFASATWKPSGSWIRWMTVTNISYRPCLVGAAVV